jgi:hypothetical protein
MGCHLNELIEVFSKKNFKIYEDTAPSFVAQRYEEIKNIMQKSVCFDIGDIKELPAVPHIPELLRSPYQSCWFESKVSPSDLVEYPMYNGVNIIGYLVEGFEIHLFRKINQDWYYRGLIRCQSFDSFYDGLVETYPASKFDSFLDVYIPIIFAFLTAINCKNVTKTENIPDKKLQKKRIKNGKTPLYSYWTLNFSIPGSKNIPNSSTGKGSPKRVHLRRGHPRRFKSGDWIWIQPMVVGTKKGIVAKDYAAKYTKD